MMATNPDYCFVMENMLNLMEYVERHPERKAEILRYTREGRMEWGATFNQPYESLLSGEQLVRQTYFGRRWLQEELPGLRRPGLFQSRCARPGAPDAADPEQGRAFPTWSSAATTRDCTTGEARTARPSWPIRPATTATPRRSSSAKPDEGGQGHRPTSWPNGAAYYGSAGSPRNSRLLHSEDFSKPTDFGPLIRTLERSHSAPDASGLDDDLFLGPGDSSRP